MRFPKGEDRYSEQTGSSSVVLAARQNGLKPDVELIFTKDLGGLSGVGKRKMMRLGVRCVGTFGCQCLSGYLGTACSSAVTSCRLLPLTVFPVGGGAA